MDALDTKTWIDRVSEKETTTKEREELQILVQKLSEKEQELSPSIWIEQLNMYVRVNPKRIGNLTKQQFAQKYYEEYKKKPKLDLVNINSFKQL